MVIRFLPSFLRKGITGFSQKTFVPYNTILNQIKSRSFSTNFTSLCSVNSPFPNIYQVPVRNSTIFTSLPSNVIWEGVTGPKGSTKKRARGKRRVTRPKIDLNRGQRLGGNREGYLWPGLNAPLFHKDTLQKVQKVFTRFVGLSLNLH